MVWLHLDNLEVSLCTNLLMFLLTTYLVLHLLVQQLHLKLYSVILVQLRLHLQVSVDRHWL